MRTRHFTSPRSSITYCGSRHNSSIKRERARERERETEREGERKREGKQRELRLWNTQTQSESVSNPWIFHSLPVENFSPTPPSRCFKGHWESDTAYLPSHLTWPINHQPRAFSHRPRWGWLCAISWKRLTPQPCQTFFFFFFLTFRIRCVFCKKLVPFQRAAVRCILIWCCSQHVGEPCTVYFNTSDK